MYSFPVVFICGLVPQFQVVSNPFIDRPVLSVSFQCPTEAIGIKTPSSIMFHSGLDKSFSIINSTSMSPLYLVQTCK